MTDTPENDADIDATEANEAPEDELETLRAENAELRDRALRMAADMDNLRKRTEREIADNRTYAIAKFARDMLAAADSLSRALVMLPQDARETGDATVKSLIEGMELTDREMTRLLGLHGVKPIEAKGEKFDPNKHQAMFEVEDPSVPPGTVVQVVQGGFVIGDRVLRPAMVGVSKSARPAAPTIEPEGIDKQV